MEMDNKKVVLEESKTDETAKKAYVAPRLTVYGKLETITQQFEDSGST